MEFSSSQGCIEDLKKLIEVDFIRIEERKIMEKEIYR